jgi:hypothetical protein
MAARGRSGSRHAFGRAGYGRRMTDDTTTNGAAKNPEDWATGEEPATPAQLSYLETLAQDTGTEVPRDVTKANASKLIDQLREKSPRIIDDPS